MKDLGRARDELRAPSHATRAERLIAGASATVKQAGEDTGIAEVDLAWAEFYSSPAVVKAESYYRKRGFLDASVTYDSRLQKSVDYYDQATPLLLKARRYDALTAASASRGVALMNMGKREDACASFDESVSFYDEQMRRDPSVKPAVPEGYGSWKEYMSRLQKWAGCAG